MELSHLTTIVSSCAVGVLTALLWKGRSRLFAAATKMDLRDTKMVMVVRSDLEVGRNKAAVYCSRAAIGCFKKALTDARAELRQWERNGQTKVVLRIPSEADMLALATVAQGAGLVAVLVHNSTPVGSDTPAVLGIGPGSAKLVDSITGHLKLF